MSAEERREALAKVLRTHREDAAYPDTCICETAAPVNAPEGRHAAHVAAALAPLVEQWIREAQVPAVFVADDHEQCEQQIHKARRDGAAEVVARVEAVLRSSWVDVRTHGDAARLIRAALSTEEPTP